MSIAHTVWDSNEDPIADSVRPLVSDSLWRSVWYSVQITTRLSIWFVVDELIRDKIFSLRLTPQ